MPFFLYAIVIGVVRFGVLNSYTPLVHLRRYKVARVGLTALMQINTVI
jgi:hypothetical protein